MEKYFLLPVLSMLSAGTSVSGASADWNEKTIRDNLQLVAEWQAKHPKNVRRCIGLTVLFIPAWCNMACPFRKGRGCRC